MKSADDSKSRMVVSRRFSTGECAMFGVHRKSTVYQLV